MPSITKTFVFLADAEGMADSGNSGNIDFVYDGADGDPASGCVRFDCSVDGLTGEIERGRRAATGQTWETWGVPAGATVTDVNVAYMRKRACDINSSASMQIRVIDSTATTVTTQAIATDTIAAGVADIAWNAGSGSSRSVNASYQASTTDVRLQLQMTVTTGAGPTAIVARYDTIELTITYTLPAYSFTVTPATLTTYPGKLSGLFTVTLVGFTAGAGGYTFAIDDGGGGGACYPDTLTIVSGATTGTFAYLNGAPGLYTLTVRDTGVYEMGTANVTVLVGGFPDTEVRVYNSDGVRVPVTENAVFECNFETLLRGGYGRGSFAALAQWEDTNLIFAGNERVDVYYREELVYRGYVRVPERTLEVSGEYARPTCYGLMDWLDTIACDRKYMYNAPVDLSVIAQDIIDDYVNVTDGVTTEYVLPSPPLPFDLTVSVNSAGFTASKLDTRGLSVAQALNALCDLAPGEVLWQMRVDSTSPIPKDQLYFGPVPTATSYRVAVGRELTTLRYNTDTSGVINKFHLNGGPVSQPNLVEDGSFENPESASELVGNLLSDYSFETGTPWTLSGGASRKQNETPHTGEWHVELDTNGETVETTNFININYQQVHTMSIWARCETGTGPLDIRMTVEGYTSGGASVATVTQLNTLTSADFRRFTMSVDFSAQSTITKVKVRCSSGADVSVGNGVIVDDVGFYFGIANASWTYALAGAATLSYIDWQYVSAFNRWHGAYAVHAAIANVAVAATDYLEVRTDAKARIRLVASRTYTMIFRYAGVDSADIVKAAIYEYKADGTSAATSVSTAASNVSAQWNTYTYQFTANANTVEAEIAVRLTGNSDIYIDGVMLIEGDLPGDAYYLVTEPADPNDTTNPWFYDGDTYQATLNVTDARFIDTLALDADAASSIDDYGVHEDRVTNEAVIDEETLLAYGKSFFNAHAVAARQGTAEVMDPPILIEPDALIQIVNLPSAPDALLPSRIETEFTQRGFVIQTIDMGEEKPDLTDLLRITEQRTRYRK